MVNDEAHAESTYTADERDQAGRQRDQSAEGRDRTADERDVTADRRDRVSDLRDDAAQLRDHVADQRDNAADGRDWRAEHSELLSSGRTDRAGLVAAEQARAAAAADRRLASEDRDASASRRGQSSTDRETGYADRAAAAAGRGRAGDDRDSARVDRAGSARDRERASFDDLTRVYLRTTGYVELKREIDRAGREHRPLTVAFVDVDHLKTVNDSRGHAAGDRVLRKVADALHSELRSYDLVMRYGGDEFVCALPGLDTAEVYARMDAVNAVLGLSPDSTSVTVGVAELQRGESADELVARADADLYRRKRHSAP